MAVVAEELYSLLIPLGSERLIVPRSCVAEVIRYSILPESEEGDGWYRGMAKWNNQDIPIVSYDRLCNREAPVPSGRTRVIVFNSLGNSPDCPPYGILSEGFPQMVKVNREVLVLDDNYRVPEGVPIICQIGLLRERALIPDLEAVEHRIVTELAPA